MSSHEGMHGPHPSWYADAERDLNMSLKSEKYDTPLAGLALDREEAGLPPIGRPLTGSDEQIDAGWPNHAPENKAAWLDEHCPGFLPEGLFAGQPTTTGHTNHRPRHIAGYSNRSTR